MALFTRFDSGGADPQTMFAWGVYGVEWTGQTFTSIRTHTITSVKLHLWRQAGHLPGTVTVSIRATAAGLPTGADLVSGTTNGDTLPLLAAVAWREIVFTAGTLLTGGTKYAIVIRATGGDINNQVQLVVDPVGGQGSGVEYSGGSMCISSDSGGTWVDNDSDDAWFEEYGTADEGWLWIEGLKLRYTDETNDAERATKYEGEQETF